MKSGAQAALALWCLGLILFCAEPLWAAAEKRELPQTKGYYILVLPKDYDAKKSYDLIVGLHGSGDTAENFANCWSSLMGERASILAIPEGEKNLSWSTNDEGRIYETIEDVAKNFKVDRKRVLLTGHSAGCFFGFMLIVRKPELFACFGGTAAGIVLAPGRGTAKDFEAIAGKVGIYYGCGKQDPNHPLYANTVDLLTKLKFNFTSEEPDIGHTFTAEELKHMLEFFDSTAKKTPEPKLVEAPKPPAADPKAAEQTPHRRSESHAEEAQKTWDEAEGFEKASQWTKALAAYERGQKEYADTALKDKFESAVKRLKDDPRAQQAEKTAEADRLYNRAENFLRNGMVAEAKEILAELIEKFPTSPAAKKAKEKSATLR